MRLPNAYRKLTAHIRAGRRWRSRIRNALPQLSYKTTTVATSSTPTTVRWRTPLLSYSMDIVRIAATNASRNHSRHPCQLALSCLLSTVRAVRRRNVCQASTIISVTISSNRNNLTSVPSRAHQRRRAHPVHWSELYWKFFLMACFSISVYYLIYTCIYINFKFITCISLNL